MCGIAGVIQSERVLSGTVERMTESIAHRGPDGFGHHYDGNFAFGHRRLSIVDLSEAGKQPMSYQDRYVITYNGEIYNHRELREELETAGYRFRSQTDTEVIMAAYAHWGPDCLNRFNGMWAFVLYDRHEHRFFIARDRFGIKPLYYAQVDGAFIFASEIKAILMHPKIKAERNEEYYTQYFKLHPNEYSRDTAFQGVHRFSHGAFFEGCSIELQENLQEVVYWQLSINESVEKFSAERARNLAQEYYELLKDAVRLRLRADVNVGSALSGGLDSSSIVYLVNQLLREQGKQELQETFSAVYKTPGTEHCDESQFIDQLATFLDVKSNQIEPLESQIKDQHAKMIWSMENPPETTLMSSWHTFAKVAETDVKVTLDGQGADEQLGGYMQYITFYLTSLTIFDFYKELPYFVRIPGSGRFVAAAFLLNHLNLVFGQRFSKWLIKKTRGWDLELSLNKALKKDFESSLVNLLHYADRTSMAHSIESRMPYMDYRLVEFLASVPACYKIRNGWTKYLARLAFDGKLPDNICWRKDKMGWPIPEDLWFNNSLKTWLEQETKAYGQKHSENIDLLGENPNLTRRLRVLNAASVSHQFNC